MDQVTHNFTDVATHLRLQGAKLHSLRHTFGTYLIAMGYDLTVVKELMGHEDIKTTLIYAKADKRLLERAMESFGELASSGYKFVLVAIVVMSHLGSAQWTRNPEEFPGVSVLSLASHGTTQYAGTAGLVYRSTDNGMTWEMLPGSPMKACAFAFSESYIFVGSQDVALGAMRSLDNGTTWAPIDKGCQKDVSSIALCDMVLLRGNSGFTGPPYLLRSTDYGNSWTTAVGIQISVYALGQRGREIYAATRLTGVPRSLDSGQTWTNPNWFCGLPANPVGLESVQALATIDTTLLAAVNTEGVFRSMNGVSWEAASSGLSNGRVKALAVSGNRLFAGTAGGGVFLAANKGVTWTPMNTGLEDLSIQTLAVQGDFLLDGPLFVCVSLQLERPIKPSLRNHGRLEHRAVSIA